MTKEQILQKHFTAEFGHDGHGEFMQYILNAMEEYAQQQVKNLFAVMPSLPIERWDVEDFLITKGISNHPQIQDSVTGKKNYEVADLIAEYANSFFRQ